MFYLQKTTTNVNYNFCLMKIQYITGIASLRWWLR